MMKMIEKIINASKQDLFGLVEKINEIIDVVNKLADGKPSFKFPAPLSETQDFLEKRLLEARRNAEHEKANENDFSTLRGKNE